jgi:hypothetical protein
MFIVAGTPNLMSVRRFTVTQYSSVAPEGQNRLAVTLLVFCSAEKPVSDLF